MLLREESLFGLTTVPSAVFQRGTGAWIASLCIAAIVIWWVLMGPDPGDRVLQEIGFALPVPNHASKVRGGASLSTAFGPTSNPGWAERISPWAPSRPAGGRSSDTGTKDQREVMVPECSHPGPE
uniref:Uncharacterized protein n=1 Tax=Candidatus Kentrum sp. TC TaxID=2126339 RepID=A0A450YXA9_9GAMM|nr:MAG: hypothetical protein BECKTC1821D_GA0114238_102835 [Candidatus Kentron sp. TC]